MRSGPGESCIRSTAPGRRTNFLFLKRKKNFCAWARRIVQWIYCARVQNRFSSLYRRENFLPSDAENPPVDLPRLGAKPTFFSYRERKIFALGCGESSSGTNFLLYIEKTKFLRSGAQNPLVDLTHPGA